MALIDRVARNVGREAVRADPVSLEEFGYLLGRSSGNVARTKAGVDVGPKRALGISAWYSGVRYLSESVAGLPVHTYRDSLTSGRNRRSDAPWLRSPDLEQTWFGLVEFWMMSLLHKGNAYAFKLRNPVGQVVGLREIHPDRVTVGQAPDGTKRFMVDRDEMVYTTWHILHIPGLAYDGRIGLNPIATSADALGGIAAVEDYAQRFFAQGTHLGGVISIDGRLTAEQIAETKAEWDRFHQGLRDAHQTGVLSNGARYERLSLNADDAQLLESKKYGVTEVARLLRIPPHKLYDLERATFSNIEHQSIEAVVDGVRPWCIRLEKAINADPHLLPSGNFVEWQLDGLLRGDSVTRAQVLTAGINGGWVTPKKAAELENLPAPDVLDYYLRPLNMAVIRDGEPVPAPEGDTAGDASRAALADTLSLVRSMVERPPASQPVTIVNNLPESRHEHHVDVAPADVTVNVPEATRSLAPVVNVAPAAVTVEVSPTPVQITNEVDARSSVTVPTPSVTVQVPEDRPSRLKVRRGPDGRISEVIEE